MDTWRTRLKRWRLDALHRPLLLLVFGLGMTARLTQYLANRSLWLDEAYLALNLLERDFAALMQPLAYNQTAPPAFLWATKAVTQWLGNGEAALRLLPLLAGLLSIPLIYHASRVVFDRHTALLAAALLGWSQQMIYFSSELKPYATDAFAVLVAYALYLPWCEKFPAQFSWRQTVLLGLGGALLLWFSYPVVFVLAALGAALLYNGLKHYDRRSLSRLLVLLLSWVVSFSALYLLVMRKTLGNAFLQAFWQPFFPTFPPRTLADLYWVAQLWFDFLVRAAGLPFYGLTTFLWLCGGLDLLRQKRLAVFLALILPLFLTLGAAILHLYPLGDRMLLFAVPFTVILVACGMRSLFSALPQDRRGIAWLCVGLLLFHPLYRTTTVLNQPWWNEEVRPAIEFIAQQRLPQDKIYVYHAAEPLFRYYAPRFGLDDEARYHVGRVSQGDFSVLVEDVDAMGEGRVWFLFAHVYAFKNISEQAYMLERLEQVGVRLATMETPGAAVFLYELGPMTPSLPDKS